MSSMRTLVIPTAVPAGHPQIITSTAEYVDLNTFFVSGGVILLKVTGDSMMEADILEGDYILLSQTQPKNGDSVVVRFNDDEYTVKTWKMDSMRQKLYLVPANGELKAREITVHDRCEVQGVVEYVIRKARR